MNKYKHCSETSWAYSRGNGAVASPLVAYFAGAAVA